MINFTKAALFGVLTFSGLAGCSGTDKDDENLTATKADDAALTDNDPTAKAVDGAKGAAVGGQANQTSHGPAASAAAPATPAAATTVGVAPAIPNSAGTAPTAMPGRVIRYVRTEQAKLFAEPKDNAPAVGLLLQGERIMVLEQSGWGRIADHMFIKLDQVSERAVSRSRTPATWQKAAAAAH